MLSKVAYHNSRQMSREICRQLVIMVQSALALDQKS